MMKKNILNVAFLATLSSLGFVNLFSADDSTKYWKYGTIASAGVGVVGTIGCLYKISQMKKNRAALEAGNLSEEDYQNLAEQIKSDKNWAIIFGFVGGAGWMSAGICGYKWRQGSKEKGSGNDGDDDLEKYKIPLPEGYKDDKVYSNEREDVYFANFLAYKNLAENSGVKDHSFEGIFNFLSKDEENKDHLYKFLSFVADGDDKYIKEYESIQSEKLTDSEKKGRKLGIIHSRASLDFDYDMKTYGCFLEKYKKDHAEALKDEKIRFCANLLLGTGKFDEKRMLKTVAHARSLSEDEKNPNYIPPKL
jgi:hypothetical protein